MSANTSPSPVLDAAMLIAQRCRDEGEAAAKEGQPQSANPYPRGGEQELESAAWADGWTRKREVIVNAGR